MPAKGTTTQRVAHVGMGANSPEGVDVVTCADGYDLSVMCEGCRDMADFRALVDKWLAEHIDLTRPLDDAVLYGTQPK